ncbi:MAG TPA: DUF4031 domain-containing protein [Micrococcaceae bacterium]
MAVYIDPPFWPAHGTLFSHLISDSSIAELQGFAAAAGIPSRAFDLDHYDVPQRRYADLVAAGAREVAGKELVRLLAASGLRVRARHRGTSLDTALLDRWERLLPGQAHLGSALLERWSEPHRRYHDRSHLLAVLEALSLLAPKVPRDVGLAAWFHDAVYDGVPGVDEERSAALLETSLPPAGIPAAEVARAARLVRLTASHDPEPGDTAGALLCDADLSVLGSEPGLYARYLSAVRADYAHLGDADFAAGRAAVVRRLLELDPLFHTDAGRDRWQARARENLAGELARRGR